MTSQTWVKAIFVAWVLTLVAGAVHYGVTPPVVQMPVHGWNLIVIALAWFGIATALSIALAIAGLWLPRGDRRRWLALVPLALHLGLVMLLVALVGYRP